MASKKSKRKSSNKSTLISVLVILLVLVIVVGVCVTLYFKNDNFRLKVDNLLSNYFDNSLGDDNNSSGGNSSGNNSSGGGSSGNIFADVLSDSNVSIHFLELGNKYTGDCTLIKCGDIEVLIDAGSRQNSAKAIKAYVDQYCTDGVLEYVIATHAHQDHIAGFVGTKDAPGIFESYVCETIIDFPRTDATSAIYKNYVAKRDAEVEAGAKHYTALECWNEENGAKRTYTLGEGVTLSILYNYYYENKTSDENDYSVCCLLDNNGTYALFTGDLEEKGESYLVEKNDLPECKLFKGGHHGSYTASTDKLLSVIKPEIVCVCCCCGSTEYTSNPDNVFPSQAFIDRVLKYTDNIYVTSIFDDVTDGFEQETVEPLNGNIVVLFNKSGEVALNCSNNNKKFTETDWFLAHRKK